MLAAIWLAPLLSYRCCTKHFTSDQGCSYTYVCIWWVLGLGYFSFDRTTLCDRCDERLRRPFSGQGSIDALVIVFNTPWCPGIQPKVTSLSPFSTFRAQPQSHTLAWCDSSGVKRKWLWVYILSLKPKANKAMGSLKRLWKSNGTIL